MFLGLQRKELEECVPKKEKKLVTNMSFYSNVLLSKDVEKEKKQCRTPYQIQFGLPNMHSFHVVEHWVEFARMPKEKNVMRLIFFFLVS